MACSWKLSKMRTTVKRILQAVIALSLVTYMTQILRQQENASETRAVDSPLPQKPDQHDTLSQRRSLSAASQATEKTYSPSLLTFESEQNEISQSAQRDRTASNVKFVTNVPAGDTGDEVASVAPTKLEDVFISVKTTKNFHRSRLDIILKTWFASSRDQTYFFTDGEDDEYQRRTGGHLINTNCTSSHNRKALCCKMSVEFDTFLESNKKWFCHFDDDNYVNVPRLVQLLQKYSPQEDWYLGKPSIRAPLYIMNRDNPQGPKISFWFATGGAGFCISRALALKMMPIASTGKFISIGDKIRLPDDVTMGYIIEHLLYHNLTVVKEFHSHLEPMKFIRPETFDEQITFSYSKYGKELNIVNIEGLSLSVDPTRFLSLHCHLFPNVSFCPK